MKNNYILDSSAIIEFPQILSLWNLHNLIIPKIVLSEISLISNVGIRNRILHTINLAEKYIEVVENKHIINNLLLQLSSNERQLSINDLTLAQIAFDKTASRQKNVYLVTNDVALINFCSKIGVQTKTPLDLQTLHAQEVLDSKNISNSNNNDLKENHAIEIKNYKNLKETHDREIKNLEELKKKHEREIENLEELRKKIDKSASDASRYQKIFSLTVTIAAITITTLLNVFLVRSDFNFSYILQHSSFLIQIALVITILTGGACVFLIRQKFRLFYAVCELSVGALTCFNALYPQIINPSITSVDVNFWIKFLGGVYVIVRGWDNFDQGVIGTGFERYWHSFKNISI